MKTSPSPLDPETLRGLRRLTLSQRIQIAFGLALLASIGIAVYVAGAMRVATHYSNEATRIAQATEAAYALNIEALGVILLLEHYQDSHDPKKLLELEAGRRAAADARTALRKHARLPAVIEALDRYETLLPQRIAAANAIVAAIESNADLRALPSLKQQRDTLDAQARELLKRIVDIEARTLTAATERNNRYLKEVQFKVLALSVLNALIILALLYSAITSGLTRRLNQLTDMARQIAVGDFSKRMFMGGNDEIAALGRTFNAMAGQLAEFDKVKEEFVALAAHQLRTPATAVKGNLGMLLEGYCGELTAEQKEILHDANTSNERQMAVIDDMLWVARAEAGRLTLDLSPTDLTRLIDEAVNEQKHVIAARKQRLHVEKLERSFTLNADRQKLRMVIENLLSNASKYTPESGTIEILLRPGRKDPDREVAISVRDSGVGIAAEDLGKLFSKFSRIANPLSDQVGGTGLGLYLAREIVKLHGGEIFVDSKIGAGSTFTVLVHK